MRGHEAFIVGGGNSAGQAAVHLARWAGKVTLLVRGSSLAGMSDYLVRQIDHLPHVEVLLDTEVIDAEGDRMLRQITLLDRRERTTRIVPAQTLFVLIGADPNTEWLAGALGCDRHGFLLTGPEVEALGGVSSRPALRFETTMPGVFAAGDVRAGSVKRVASAVGEGAVALQFIREYLEAPVDVGRPDLGTASPEARQPHV
jgi:thioredoxin reductase (NADPH)